MTSVVVLAPNGRRQTVKCTPNTTILQVLEEVCKKQGFKSDEYDIKHHNKVLDTTTTIRFSGLPNNAQLELCEIVKLRLETDVTLALILEDGSRLIGNFKPSETLISVLTNLCPETVAPEKHPVVVYTRREIYGTELQSTTLKSLGITGGRAMIRLMNKAPEELKVQANISAPLPSKPVGEKPYRSRNLQRTVSPPRQTQPEINSNVEVEKMDVDVIEPEPKPKKYEPRPNVDLIKLAKERKRSPEKPSVKPAKVVNQGAKLSSVKNCNCSDNPNDVCCDLNCSKTCTNQESETNVDEQFVFLGSRNAMLFSLETAIAVPSEELPDDFYDLTLDDARKILRDVKRKRQQFENTPLRTSALRELEESKKQLRLLNRYKKAVIRIQFPDRTVLQGTFAPHDTVQTVLDFVREFIEDKKLNFYVYSAPPKVILDAESKLIEIGCVPGALLHFGVTDGIATDQYLRKDLRNKFTTSSVASLAASKIRNENTRNTCTAMDEEDDFEQESLNERPVNDGASTSTGITHENYERKIVKTTENVPKWFKPSK